MEYQNTDEAIKKEACEKVRQIANAIIKIRKKYYLCFSKISKDDKTRYDALKAQMKSIACENGLEKLSAQLISDIDIQYGEDMPNETDENGNQSNGSIEDLHQKFINAVAMQAELTGMANEVIDTDIKLANAYIKKAGLCQKRAKEYYEVLVEKYSKDRLSSDRLTVFRDKFGKLTKGYILDLFKNCRDEFSSKNLLIQEDIIKEINECIPRKLDITSNLETGRV